MYAIGCYLSPDVTSTIESVVAALKERPRDARLLVARDLNVNLAETEVDRREEEIAAALATVGLEKMLYHFFPQRCPWCQDGRTWSMVRAGREVRYRTNYIIGTYRRLFWNLTVRDPRHKSYH